MAPFISGDISVVIGGLQRRVTSFENNLQLWRNDQLQCVNRLDVLLHAPNSEEQVARLLQQNDDTSPQMMVMQTDISQMITRVQQLELSLKVAIVREEYLRLSAQGVLV